MYSSGGGTSDHLQINNRKASKDDITKGRTIELSNVSANKSQAFEKVTCIILRSNSFIASRITHHAFLIHTVGANGNRVGRGPGDP